MAWIMQFIFTCLLYFEPFQGAFLVYDPHGLGRNMETHIIERLNLDPFTVEHPDNYIIGLTDEGMGDLDKIEKKVPEDALVFVYFVGGEDMQAIYERIARTFKDHPLLCLGINDDEISEVNWVAERLDGQLLKLLMYEFWRAGHT